MVSAGRNDTPHARNALEKLCRAYWFPIYAFVRRQGHGPHDAQDLTQEFFARLLEKKSARRRGPGERPVSFVPAGVAETFSRQRMGQDPGPKNAAADKF